ncbi:hypothetical protein FUAX_36650 [Fulvitalea axinellae]|uniref:TraB/GumN family protein n=1 Tax=Fulvitalea axinellae TaxID=1182444 RepID=A0AAU9CM05_9BACT|nr:hypothetical protein FUAX_36650 [Fulvitalea axinellae]
MRKQILPFLCVALGIFSCQNQKGDTKAVTKAEVPAKTKLEIQKPKSDKVQVMNFGTFHMGYTPDATTVDFDEHNAKNQTEVRTLVKSLAAFKPTVICVEVIPENEAQLNEAYQKFLSSGELGEYVDENGLVAFELGKLAGVKKIYAIDHKMGYNYRIASDLDQDKVGKAGVANYEAYYPQYFKKAQESGYDTLSVTEKLRLSNTQEALDFYLTINADQLTHFKTDGKFEGADEAAKYYKRNLRMFANFNQVPVTKNDRIFILMGASHTAFFQDFLRRSPVYETVNPLDYFPPKVTQKAI